MKNRIDIVIRGLTSSGKTGILSIIHDILTEKGLMVTMRDKKLAKQVKYNKQFIEKELVLNDPIIVLHELNVPREK